MEAKSYTSGKQNVGMGIKLNDRCILQFVHVQTIIAYDREDIEDMVRKLIDEYEKWVSRKIRRKLSACVLEQKQRT